MIDSKSLGKKPSETIRRVARYYYDSGYDKRKVRKLVEEFMLSCDNSISLPKWTDAIEYALNAAKKYAAVNIDKITVTVPEMNIIDSLDSVMTRRLAFTLLCIAKYWDIVTAHDSHWVNSKDNEIMSMANINTSIKRQSAMYHNLYSLGLIRFSRKVDNTNVQICFIKDGDTAMEISDFRNLGFQYAMYHEPDKYFVCENCGVVLKKGEQAVGRPGRPKLYCRGCAAEITLRNNVESVMRIRNEKNA